MFNPLGTMFGKVMSGVAVVLLLAVAVQTIRVERLQTIVAKLTGQNKALRHSLDEIKDATAVADRKAREAKAAAEAEYKRKAEITDAKYESALADARARAADYARRMRVKAPGGASSGPATPADRGGAEGADRSDQGTFVAVSEQDFGILTENTERLKAAREWACSLDGARCE